jgi:hypothetical protein
VDSQELVDGERRQLGAELIGLLKSRGFDVGMGAWIFDETRQRWRLIIATPRVEEMGIQEAYRELNEIAGEDDLISALVDLVTLVSPETAGVANLLSVLDDEPGERGAPSGSGDFRGEPFDDGLVYALDHAAYEYRVKLAIQRVVSGWNVAFRRADRLFDERVSFDFVVGGELWQCAVEVKLRNPDVGAAKRILSKFAGGFWTVLVVSPEKLRPESEVSAASEIDLGFAHWTDEGDDEVLGAALGRLLRIS